MNSTIKGFSTIELVGAIILFSAATSGVLYMGKAMHDHQLAAASMNQQNAYATFQSQVTLQGIDPTLVANPLAGAINQGQAITGGGAASGQNLNAVFEMNAVTKPAGAQRSLAGSVRVDAINYNVAAAGNAPARGAGIGFSIETTGPAAPAPPNAIQLAPPVFNVTGDLTNLAFPVNNIATLPISNPPGTVYRYTTDGTTPTGSSPIWDNNPGWTPSTFPATLTLAAFNPDPQYAASAGVTASYSMQLNATYGRADNRTSNLYGFSIAELSSPGATGIVLSDNIDGYVIFYTLDGSDPTSSPTAAAYNGPFVPGQSFFGPSATLRVAAVSTDPRITSSPIQNYTLSAEQTPLTAPSFVTSNAEPLAPETPVVISVNGSSGSPRTAVNNGAPTQSSSSATSFPLN
jgi:hypothetical protein